MRGNLNRQCRQKCIVSRDVRLLQLSLKRGMWRRKTHHNPFLRSRDMMHFCRKLPRALHLWRFLCTCSNRVTNWDVWRFTKLLNFETPNWPSYELLFPVDHTISRIVFKGIYNRNASIWRQCAFYRVLRTPPIDSSRNIRSGFLFKSSNNLILRFVRWK